MYSLSQLERQQVGLRLPRYIVDELDELASNYSLNRTDLIFEAVRSYIERQKEEQFYQELGQAIAEVKSLKAGKSKSSQSLEGLIDELNHSAN